MLATDEGFEFFTDDNQSYFVYFNQGTNYFTFAKGLNLITYDFGFECTHDVNDHKFDKRIADTIADCIHKFFKKNPESIIAYTCEARDSYELLRFRLFNIWHATHFKEYCNKLSYQTYFKDEKGGSWFCGSIIFQKNNPSREFIEASFYKESSDSEQGQTPEEAIIEAQSSFSPDSAQVEELKD